MKKILFGNRISVAIWSLIFTALIAKGGNYFALIPMNLQSSELWWYIVLIMGIGIGIAFIFNAIYCAISDDCPNWCDDFGDVWRKYTIPLVLIAIAVIWILILFFTSISGWKMFNAEKYSSVISIEDGCFEEDIIDADSSENIISVDVETAQKLGDRTLGTIQNASWFDVDDEYNLISYNGEEYRLSAINYGDFWKATKASENGGIPGYVLVNAKTQEAKFIEKPGIKYSPSAVWEYDLDRHLYNKYPSYIFGKSFFEIDENGEPYWITSVKEATIGLRGAKVNKSLVICNAITGECQEYKIDQVPEWVDHVHSVSDLMELIGWNYEYKNGYWNLSKTNVYRTSYSYYSSNGGYNSVVSKNGEIMFVTTITPANRAETIKGFIGANSRTGKVTFYDVTGAEESSAQKAAEALVQNFKYVAGFPVIINVEGVETYFMTLKDGAGLVKKYALSNVEDYTKCVEADTIEDAVDKYKIAIGLKAANNGDKDNESTDEEITNYDVLVHNGIVTAVKEAQIEGFTHYYFTVEGLDIIFVSSIENSHMQPMKLVVGTNVAIKYYTSNESSIGNVVEIKFS